MAKTVGPLHSVDAHGSMAKTLTYSRRRSGSQVRSFNKPTGTPSAKQRGQRRLTEFLVAQWQNMSDAAKAVWETNAKASNKNLPGYQYFLREAQRDLYTHHGLAAYWHCNEIVGGKILDLSGNTNHGTLQPSYPSNAPTIIDSKTPRMGKALYYDGIDEQVDCGAKPNLSFPGASEFTILVWINIDSVDSQFHYIVSKWSPGNQWILRLGDNNLFQFHWHDGAPKFLNANGVTPIANKWYQLAATFKIGEQKIYVNGLPRNSATESGNITANNDKVYISSQGGSASWFKGIIDEVCIYNRFFSDEEIKTRYDFIA